MAEFVVMSKSKRKAATPKPAAGPAAAPPAAPAVTAGAPLGAALGYDQIAKRAYDIWVRQGRPQGQAQQHWYQAEAELRAELKARPQA